MLKKIIKFSTCRRRIAEGPVEHGRYAGSSARRWKQTFKVGYIQQAFTRACVRESLQHGEENAPFRQRVDVRRTMAGKASNAVKFVDPEAAPSPKKSIYTLSKEQAEAQQ